VERSEWPDDDASGDDAYPVAPVPAHERTWRHPSELGRPVWAHSEPPITIGRGLLLTTGAIGGLLSLAVLWAMLPSAGRGDEAAPTAVTSRANDLPATIITARPNTFVATTLIESTLPVTTLRASTVATTAAPDSTAPTATAPTDPTDTTVGGTTTELLESPPVAVGVGNSLVITTARAVNGRTSITLTDGDGKPHDAAVLMVDRERGLAVLSADAAAVTTSYDIGPAASAGDAVTVLGTTPSPATVAVAADGHLTLDGWPQSTPEGAPIVNGDGQLIGICSRGPSGVEVISVAGVGAMLAPSTPAAGAAWLGIHVAANDQGGATVDMVDPDGPASAVGVVVGDVISAVDGVTIHNVDELKVAIAGHQPGQAVTLSITHADQTSTDVDVTLGSAPSM